MLLRSLPGFEDEKVCCLTIVGILHHHNGILQMFKARVTRVYHCAEQLFLEKKARLLGQYGGEDYASLVQEAATPEKSNADDAPRQLYQPGDLCRVPYRHVWGGVQVYICGHC